MSNKLRYGRFRARERMNSKGMIVRCAAIDLKIVYHNEQEIPYMVVHYTEPLVVQ